MNIHQKYACTTRFSFKTARIVHPKNEKQKKNHKFLSQCYEYVDNNPPRSDIYYNQNLHLNA